MLKYLISITNNREYNNICGSITNNQKSVDVFTHIGMKKTEENWYEISLNDLIKWLN